MHREEIRNKINSAERGEVATIYGCTKDYVNKVLRGDRKNTEILTICSKMVEGRIKLVNELSNITESN